MGSLVDPATKKAVDGGIERVDDFTVKLNLPQPDISLVAGMADYPALIMHRSYEGESDPMKALAITTGPCELVRWDVETVAEVRRKDKPWWKGDFALDGIRWIDYGSDPNPMFSAFESGEIDTNHETSADTLSQVEALGLTSSEIATGSTIVARFNAGSAPYDDMRIRRAAQLSVDNGAILKLGLNDHGTVGENHHVGPMHPEYADIGPHVRKVEEAKTLLAEAGKAEHEYDLISVDVEWQKSTADAIAAQIREAGLKVKRTVLPAATFWNDWNKYPFSCTEWLGRPLGVQVLALAYKSGPGTRAPTPTLNSMPCSTRRWRRPTPRSGARPWPRSNRICATRASSSSPTGARSIGHIQATFRESLARRLTIPPVAQSARFPWAAELSPGFSCLN